MTFLKFGKRYLNMAQVTDVVFYGNEALITLTANGVEWASEDFGATIAQTIKLSGVEVMALKWWLDCNSRDAIAGYEMALQEAEGR